MTQPRRLRFWLAALVGRGVLPALLSFALALHAQSTPFDPVASARAFVRLLQDQEFAKAESLFAEAMRSALPAGKLKAAWDGVLLQVGAFKQYGDASSEDVGGVQRVTLEADFERASIDLVVVYTADGRIGGFTMRPHTSAPPPWSPPAYAELASFTEAEVTVGSDGWPLPGALSMPTGAGPFPAVVLVHGSGANDRDESYGPNKMFKDLAYGLASRGIAVLRYDKRSKVHGARLAAVAGFTVNDEVVDDARAAVAFLRRQPRIDARRVVALGHSLGGMLLPRVATSDSALAGLIVMAGVAGDLPAAMVRQTAYLAAADDAVSPDEQRHIDAAKQFVSTVAGLTSADAGRPGLMQGAPASYWLDLRGFDAPSTARQLQQPMLVLQGERDYQVTMGDDFSLWKAALTARNAVTFHTYPALNHFFLSGQGPSLPDEYAVPGHVPGEVIEDIVDWIRALHVV